MQGGFLVLAEIAGLGRIGVTLSISLFLNTHDVGSAFVSGEQVGPVVGFQERRQRIDPGEKAHQIVLATQRKHRLDQVMAHAVGAHLHLEPVGEERDELVCNRHSFSLHRFKHMDLTVDNPDGLKRQPFNAKNPDGPLELCVCAECGTPIMLDDKEGRIRAIVPNLMGYGEENLAATYHAFYDASTGESKPDDGQPVYEGLRPDFVWPASAST